MKSTDSPSSVHFPIRFLCSYFPFYPQNRWLLDEKIRFGASTIKQNDLVDVTVTHIVSPQEFYVTKISEAPKYAKMSDKLQTAYNQLTNEVIYVPRAEMICAVNIDGRWFRGRLTGKASTARDFNVWLVDVGTTQTVHWGFICQIGEMFRILPEAATCCSLAHVTPNAGLWSADALVAFQRATKQTARIHADVVEAKPGHHDVVLYQMPENQFPICINEMLVEKGFAIADALLLSSRPKVDCESISEDSYSKTDCTLSSSNEKKPIVVDHRTRVNIVHIVSPGEFYVTLKKHISGVDQMHHLVQQHIQTKIGKSRIETWKSGDLCLAKTNLKDTSLSACWYRGRILSVDGKDETASVFLRDRGLIVSLDLSAITSSPEKFKSVTDGAIRCHMVGVQPTNGNTKWSATAIDEFREVANGFEGRI